MITFDELWQYITDRSNLDVKPVVLVQEKVELRYIFDLMKDCDSYLEIGSAEGNSLYVLGHALKEKSRICIVDYGEPHTKAPREIVVKELGKSHRNVLEFNGDSTFPETFPNWARQRKYDCVLIDGGHDYTTVLSDAIMYGPLASKYIFFHDIQLPEVKAAVDWFIKRHDLGEYHEFINSTSFGYGIIKVR